MNKNVDEIFSLLEKEEYLSALNLCGELIDCFQTRFMEDLTVNTATDYVGAVILYAKICSVIKKPWKSYNYLETSRGALRFLKDYLHFYAYFDIKAADNTDFLQFRTYCFAFLRIFFKGLNKSTSRGKNIISKTFKGDKSNV